MEDFWEPSMDVSFAFCSIFIN